MFLRAAAGDTISVLMGALEVRVEVRARVRDCGRGVVVTLLDSWLGLRG